MGATVPCVTLLLDLTLNTGLGQLANNIRHYETILDTTTSLTIVAPCDSQSLPVTTLLRATTVATRESQEEKIAIGNTGIS